MRREGLADRRREPQGVHELVRAGRPGIEGEADEGHAEDGLDELGDEGRGHRGARRRGHEEPSRQGLGIVGLVRDRDCAKGADGLIFALASEAEGHTFESCIARQVSPHGAVGRASELRQRRTHSDRSAAWEPVTDRPSDVYSPPP